MKKQSLDEHWLDQPGLTPEQAYCVIAAANYTEAMREQAMTWAREKVFIITAEAEDGLRIADSEELESAIGEANGETLRKWMANPAAVTLDSGWEILRATPAGADVSGMLKAFQRGDYGAGWHVVCASGNPDAKPLSTTHGKRETRIRCPLSSPLCEPNAPNGR